MEYLLPAIEQLDLAATLMDADDPIRSRLALILTDNIIELMAHAKCQEIDRRERMRRQIGSGTISTKELAKALGRHFDQKVRFLARQEEVSAEDRDVALGAHRFRNEAYHLGILHDDFIFELAWTYHDLACRWFSQLRPGAYRVPQEQELGDAARRHMGRGGPFPDDWATIGNSLASQRPSRARPLPMALSECVVGRLDRLEDGLAFLTDAPNWATVSEVVRDVGASFGVSEESLSRWRRRATAIGSVDVDSRALQRFQRLIGDLEDFELEVESAAAAWDAEVDRQVEEHLLRKALAKGRGDNGA